MSRHILDHRSMAKTGLRLARFARLGRRAGLNPRLARLFRRTRTTGASRTRAYVSIERQR